MPFPELDLSLGAIEVGTLITSAIYGTSLVQMYTFYTYHDTRMWLKFAVAAVCLFETFHMLFSWIYLYHVTVTEFGNVAALIQMPWYFGVAVTFQATAGGIVQCLYIWRVYVLSVRRWYLAIIPGSAILVKEIASIMSTALSLQASDLPEFQKHYGYVIYIATISSAITDVWNTALLCWFLRSRRTSYSDGVITWIILWALETGFLTTVTTILIVAFWATMPSNGLWLAASLIYSHLYSNSLMVSINHRSSDRKSIPDHRVYTRSDQVRQEPRSYDLSGQDSPITERTKGIPLQDLHEPGPLSMDAKSFDSYGGVKTEPGTKPGKYDQC